MSVEELEAFAGDLPPETPPEDPAALASALVDSNKLTPFQAEVLLGDAPTPLRLGNYLLLDRVGSGGMGHVHKAIHERMNRIVAIKILPPTAAMDESLVKRFRREVQVAAQLHHANIVTAYDADEADGLHFLVMELVDGRDLGAIVEENGPLEVSEALDCIEQAAEALAYAHGRGVLHRDVKPANLLREAGGHVKVLDMGLARLESSDGLTTTGEVLGTVATMAPEQGDDTTLVDARSDVYGLGCTLHYLLTGAHVYEGDSPLQVLLAHAQNPIPDVCATRPDVPPAVGALFTSMVQKRREDRPQTMQAVIDAVRALREDREPDLPPPAPTATRKPRWLWPAVAVLVAALGIGVWQAFGGDPAPDTPPAPTGPRTLAPSQTWIGHIGTVHAVAAHPDGKRVLAGSGDNTVGVWDIATGKQLARLEGHEDAVRGVVCLSDGTTVITCSDDTTLRIWDLTTGTTRKILRGHTSKVRSLALAPDESYVASVSKDATLRIWDLPAGTERIVRTEHGEWPGDNVGLMDVAIDPRGTRLVSVGFDEMVRLWDGASFEVTRALGPEGSDIGAVAISSDGRFILHDFDAGPVRVLNEAATAEVRRLNGHTDWVYSIACAPDGAIAATGSQDQTIRLWDLETGTCLAILEGHEFTVGALAFSRDGRTLFSGSGDDTVRVWDLAGVLPTRGQ